MSDLQLIKQEDVDPVAIYANENAVAVIIDSIRSRAESVAQDSAGMTPSAARAHLVGVAHAVRRSKVYLDDAGKNLVSDWKRQAKVVDGGRKRMRDDLDALAVEIRRPVTEHEVEQAEIAARRKVVETAISDAMHCAAAGIMHTMETLEEHAAYMATIISAIDDDETERSRHAAADAIATAITAKRQQIADAAELERLRAEREEAERMETERAASAERERQRVEQGLAAERAKMDDERAELTRQKEAAEAATAAAEQATANAERARAQAEADAAVAAETARREAKEAAGRIEAKRIEDARLAEVRSVHVEDLRVEIARSILAFSITGEQADRIATSVIIGGVNNLRAVDDHGRVVVSDG